jgi:hypothetical protein
MSTSNTLFGHLASRFSTHPENLATEALLYLLTNAQNAKDLFARYLAAAGDNFNTVNRFSSQVSSDGDTIPDLVGTDVTGNSIFIIENKFWAELTPNQPLGYLPLLPPNLSSALFFVCPEKRLRVLQTELFRLIGDAGQYEHSETIQQTGDVVVNRITDSQYMVIVSWRRLLADLEAMLDPIAERTLIADLHQLRGLCEQMDYEGFIPLRTGETGNLEIPRRIIDYRELIDAIVNVLRDSADVATGGLAAAASAHSSGRYIYLRKRGEFGAYLALDFELWRKFGLSSIWLKFHYTDFGRAEEAAALLSNANFYIDYGANPRAVVTPIMLAHSSDRQKVIQDSAQQIRAINQILLDSNR